MKSITFIKYKSEILIVVGFGIHPRFNNRECYVCTKLEDNIERDRLSPHERVVPIEIAEEITNEEELRAIWLLYG